MKARPTWWPRTAEGFFHIAGRFDGAFRDASVYSGLMTRRSWIAHRHSGAGVMPAIAMALMLAACTPAPPSGEADTKTDPAPTQSGEPQTADAALPADCAIVISRPIAFTQTSPGDTLEARALPAPTCQETVLVLTVRARSGAVLHAFAAPFSQMSQGASPAALRATLDAWAGATVDDTSVAPAWTGAADTFPAAFGSTGQTPFIKSTYEGLRAQKRPRLCFAASYEATACIYYEAESERAGLLYQTGP
jgi:hypothetical protein